MLFVSYFFFLNSILKVTFNSKNIVQSLKGIQVLFFNLFFIFKGSREEKVGNALIL